MTLRNEKGQMILILLLLITVGLGIGLSIIQRSLSDVSTSTKVEQSSRAFSAAEAGIERALRGGETNFQLESSTVSVDVKTVPSFGQAFEYPPLSKEEVAHIWLVNPTDLTSQQYPNGSSLYIYWGYPNSSLTDSPALELTFVYQTASSYSSKKFFYDLDAARRSNNGFADPGSCAHSPLTTSLSNTPKSFKCMVTVNINNANFPGLTRVLILRVRLLYATVTSPLSVGPQSGQSLPIQGRLLVSTARVGDVQRKLQLLNVDQVVPFYFDYALFSSGEISK